jgi:cell envelope opacity-associated protein A
MRYPVHVPAGSGPAVLSALELIPAARRTAWRLYRVTEGDTLTSIARLHKTASKEITAVNASAGEVPEAGSLLIVPAPEPRRQTASAASRPLATAKAPARKKSVAKAPGKRQPVAKAPATKQPVAKTVTAPIGTALAATRPSGNRPSGVVR